VHPALEAHLFQHGLDALLPVGARHAEQLAVEVEQAVAGVVVGEAVVLGQVADAGPRAGRAGRSPSNSASPSQ